MKVLLSFSAAVFMSLFSTAGNAAPEWHGIGHPGSYGDGYAACSKTSVPSKEYCSSNSNIGNIAVCFEGRNEGHPHDDCKTEANWCGYQGGVNLSKVTTEQPTGIVYFCANKVCVDEANEFVWEPVRPAPYESHFTSLG
ncbi:hypothetical protein IWQ51_006822 [Labrenzia sp. EL_142]|nr:hypothetical protein [Labrenzia sp. EL_142]